MTLTHPAMIGGLVSAKRTPTSPFPGYELAFNDDFSGTTLDPAKWITRYPWTLTNSPNNEEQWYTYDGSNVSVQDGYVRLQAREDPSTHNLVDYPYSSGIITTGRNMNTSAPARFSFQYGYVEARVRIPSGRGLWPAIWLLPVDATWPPEIDIMEILGHDTNTVHMNYHYGTDPGHPVSPGSRSGTFGTGWHTFAVDWQPTHIRWYVDGVQARPAFTSTGSITSKTMYVLVNLAVGGNWPGSPDGGTVFPANYDIDYVRVWRQPGAGGAATDVFTEAFGAYF